MVRYVAKQVESDEDLEDGLVEVELDEKDLLEEIDDDLIKSYAIRWCGVIDEDDITTVDNADEDELISALEDLNYNFSDKVDEDEMIESLEGRGYIVEEVIKNNYDYIDSVLYDEIFAVFDSLDCFSRKRLRDEILKFK